MNEKPTAERNWRWAACGGKGYTRVRRYYAAGRNLMKVSEETYKVQRFSFCG